MSVAHDQSRYPWQPTAAVLRSASVGVGALILALVLHRPDVLVLGVPLVIISVWSVLGRPQEQPAATCAVSSQRLREGEAVDATISVSGAAGARSVSVSFPDRRWVQFNPAGGTSMRELRTWQDTTTPVVLSTVIRHTRWGERNLGPVQVTAVSDWGAYRWGPVPLEVPLTRTLPTPAVFDAHAPTPHPAGLVGLHTSRRPGDGAEFSNVRAFQLGDRLRRIHWPISLKTGELHVTSTYADQDTLVVLVVDATTEVGISEGIDGSASSLDITVRAAGAIAEHYLRQGDRVGMRILGKARRSRVAANSGRRHLTQILDTLATISAAQPRQDVERASFGLTSGALAVILSPLTSVEVLTHAGSLVHRGLTVLLVDTLPADYVKQATDPLNRLARRIRVLERRDKIDAIQEAGVAVTQWRGPGSLDHVLRQASRRDRAPTMGRR